MIPSDVAGQMTDVYTRIHELERRARNRKRTGTVAEVGSGENAGKYRVKLSDQGGTPYLSPWIRPRTLGAGGVKIDVLLSQGEQVDVHSETGDLVDATIDLSTYSEQYSRENDGAPLHIKIGDSVISASGSELVLQASTIKLSGNIETTGSIKNNGKDIGSTHVHMTPAGLSDPPQ